MAFDDGPALYIYILLLKNIFLLYLRALFFFVLCFFRGHINSVSVHPSGRLALSVAKDKTLR